MAQNTGKVREFCQSGKVGTLYQMSLHGGGGGRSPNEQI